MATILEKQIAFDFGDRWQVEKWDKCRVYVDGIGKLNGTLSGEAGEQRHEGTKAVDMIGVLDGKTLYLFEVKDFRAHRIENKKRQTGELPLEIGLKVRDTIAGLVGAYLKHATEPWVEPCGRALVERKHQIHVVAWIVDDALRPTEPEGKRAAHHSVRLKRIQQRLAWLTPRVWVYGLHDTNLPDVVVRNLPGAGEH
jgi:hypothetical protein